MATPPSEGRNGIGTVTLDMGFSGDADVLLLCLYDEGSFVSALALFEIEGLGEYRRLGLAHVESKTGTRIDEWKLRTVILG